ncbi:hypothetical protein DV738_g4481, partial [Chaetothyriales sp. CBS 135597]
MSLSSASYPQASQPPFQFSSSVYPSLDPELNMADTFQQTISSHLQDAARAAGHRNGDLAAITVAGNAPGAAGMGPPRAPHQQSFSPTEHRTSLDETGEGAPGVDGTNKRRRSKVSRACDECRRKKIKCDSADGPDDTAIKTCTNCAKASMQCEFSRVPMKRGPSKGYIKELSERVEKMESRQAAMAPTAYGRSVDGTSISDSPYLTDDPLSAKRHFSFSDIRQPFEPVDYQHGRGSNASAGTGVWSADFGIAHHSRDRQSLAIAPDQQLPTDSTTLWTEVDDLEQPRPKRPKTESAPPPIKATSVDLTNYEDVVHPLLPLLPERSIVSSEFVIPAENTEALRVFATVLGLLPASSAPRHRIDSSSSAGVESSTGSVSAPTAANSDHFTTYTDLVEAISRLTRQNPYIRANRENVILMWSCALLAVLREFDVRTNQADLVSGSRSELLKSAMDLADHLQDDRESVIQDAVGQSKTIINVLTRWDWFASGAERNWSKTGFRDFQSIPDYRRADYSRLANNGYAFFVTALSRTFKRIQNLIQSPTAPDLPWIRESLDDTLEFDLACCLDMPQAPSEINDDAPIVRQCFEFVKLLTSAYHARPVLPAALIQHALTLAQLLTEDSESTTNPDDAPFRYTLTDYHLFSLTVTSLLAFLNKSRTWMEALLTMIEKVPRDKWAISKTDELPLLQGQDFLDDFMSLVRTGYGRILAAYGGRGDKRKRNDEEQASKRRKVAEGDGTGASALPIYATQYTEEELKDEQRRPKKKVAVLIGYAGTGYRGMQFVDDHKTIEGDLFKAFVEAGAISKANADDPKKSSFVRCARTDKGVHAAGNVVSLKLIVEDEDIVERINKALVPQIRVWGFERTSNSFSAYQMVDSRIYEYLIPSHSFLPPHPTSFLGRQCEEWAKKKGDYDEWLQRQEEVKGFWEKVDSEAVRPILDEYDAPTRAILEKALFLHGSSSATAEEVQQPGNKAVETVASDQAQADASEPPAPGETVANDQVQADTSEPAAPVQTAASDQAQADASEPVAPVDKNRRAEIQEATKRLRAAYLAAKRAYRIPQKRLDRIRDLLKMYVGTKNYHNFTIDKTSRDPSAKRVIKSFVVNETPILINGTEWLSLKVHGQSFMMHQIRKMVGMVALMVRCGTHSSRLYEALGHDDFSIPKAPALGLLLERPVFDSYNKRATSTLDKQAIDFDKFKTEMDAFKQKEIYERMYRDEESENVFGNFFNHLDNFPESAFLYLTSGGLEATKEEAPKADAPERKGGLKRAIAEVEQRRQPPTPISHLMAQAPSLVYLPYEILVSIVSLLTPYDQVLIALTCRRIYHLVLETNATPNLKTIFPKCSHLTTTTGASSSSTSTLPMCPRNVSFYDYTNPHIHNMVTLLRHLKNMAGAEWRFCCTLQSSMFGKEINGHGCRLVPAQTLETCHCPCIVCVGGMQGPGTEICFRDADYDYEVDYGGGSGGSNNKDDKFLPWAKRSWYRRLMMELDIAGEAVLVEMEWRRIQRLRRFRMLGH